jgi:hypothetical protein
MDLPEAQPCTRVSKIEVKGAREKEKEKPGARGERRQTKNVGERKGQIEKLQLGI